MKFGKRLRNQVDETLPEWKHEFLSYKKLKKKLNLIDSRASEGHRCNKQSRFVIPRDCQDQRGKDVNMMRDDIGFIGLLEGELDKVNTFFIEKEEDYIIGLKELQDRVANLSCNREMLEVQKDILAFHGEMVLLLHYSVLNFTGLMKIVKKHNKKTSNFICLPSMARVPQQPFFSTDLLYKLMTESEAMLNRLVLGNNP